MPAPDRPADVLGVWADGGRVPAERAPALLAAGHAQGLGVFETLMIRRGRPFAISRHLDRLTRGALRLGLVAPDAAEVARAVSETHRAAGSPDRARVRIQWSATDRPGNGPQAAAEVAGEGRRARLSVVLSVAGRQPSPGLRVARSSWTRNENSPLAGIKTTSYAENVVALDEARRRGADEALLANTRGQLCEGTFTNVFVARGPGIFLTPPLSSGCLPGIMRELVLEWAASVEIDISEESVEFDYLGKEENSTILLSSAVRGLVPVTRLDGLPLPLGGSAERLIRLVRARLETAEED